MKNYIIIALSTIVLALASYLLYNSMNNEMSEAEIQTEFNDLKTNFEFLQKNLESNMGTLQISSGIIGIQKKKIDALMRKNSISEEELNQAKKLMQEISQSVLDEYQKRVAYLEKEKVALVHEKTYDEKELVELNSKIKKIQLDNSLINKNFQNITSKYKIEKTTSTKKDELIKYASKITASNFILKGYKVRDSGKEIETDRASKIDRLKMTFEINENKLAENGVKELYIVTKNSDGSLMTFADKPTGNISFEGKSITYSDKISVNYSNNQTKIVETSWDSEDFKRGDYLLEIYEKTKDGNVSLVSKATKSLD